LAKEENQQNPHCNLKLKKSNKGFVLKWKNCPVSDAHQVMDY
jgi:hypothetical protein